MVWKGITGLFSALFLWKNVKILKTSPNFFEIQFKIRSQCTTFVFFDTVGLSSFLKTISLTQPHVENAWTFYMLHWNMQTNVLQNMENSGIVYGNISCNCSKDYNAASTISIKTETFSLKTSNLFALKSR